MAYADKMHFSKEEYIQIKKLWLKTRKKQIRELGSEIWMYPFSALERYKSYEDGEFDFNQYEYKYDPSESDLDIESMNDDIQDYTVFNVSTKTELWLLKNFKLPCIKREVEKQLSEFFYQEIPDELKFNLVDKLDFSIPDTILSIEGISDYKQISLWFFSLSDSDNNIQLYNKYVLFGTTDVYKVIHDAKECISGCENHNYKIQFTFCGLDLFYENGVIYHEGKEIVIPYIEPNYYNITITHTYNVKDAEKLHPTQILISGHRMIGNLDVWEKSSLKRILFTEIPEYLYNMIKK